MNDCRNSLKVDRNYIKANLIYARCYMHRGKLDKAKDSIKFGLDKTNENNYLSWYIPNLENEVIY